MRAGRGGGWQAQTSLRTRVDLEGEKNRTSPCPARGSNPGSSDLNSDDRPSELRPSRVVLGSKHSEVPGTGLGTVGRELASVSVAVVVSAFASCFLFLFVSLLNV